MLWYERTVSYEEAALWVRERRSDNGGSVERKCVPSLSQQLAEPTPRRHLSTALSALARLHILTESSDGRRTLIMHERFRGNFRRALTGG